VSKTLNSHVALRRVLIALAFACGMLVTRPTFAVILTAGAGGFTPAAPSLVGATPVISLGPVHFVSPTFEGYLTSAVYANDSTNPFGPGFLTFTYQLQSVISSAHDIHRLSISSFNGFQVDASYTPSAGVIPPSTVDRSLGLADVVGFNFPTPLIGITPPPGFAWFGPLVPGGTSALMVIHTDAVDYQRTFVSVIDGSTANVASFAPLKQIPEPSTLTLAALGTIGLAVAVRRRKASV